MCQVAILASRHLLILLRRRSRTSVLAARINQSFVGVLYARACFRAQSQDLQRLLASLQNVSDEISCRKDLSAGMATSRWCQSILLLGRRENSFPQSNLTPPSLQDLPANTESAPQQSLWSRWRGPAPANTTAFLVPLPRYLGLLRTRGELSISWEMDYIKMESLVMSCLFSSHPVQVTLSLRSTYRHRP